MTALLDDHAIGRAPDVADAGNRWLVASLAGVVLACVVVVAAPPTLPRQVLAGGVLSLVALPSLLRHFVPARLAVALALCLTLVPLSLGLLRLVGIHDPAEGQIHDGTVLNDEAARMVIRGENPYHGDFREALPPVWRDLGYVDGELIRNPALDTYAYLPASFLVNVPFVAAGDALGLGWDARLLYLLAVVGLAAVVARRPEPAHARAALLVGAIGLPLVYYLWWGTNDAIALSLFLIGALVGHRHPKLAGLALGAALSFKIVLGIPLLALAAFLVRTEGWAALRRRWTCAALVVATVLPYLVADPGGFLGETVLFNLNKGTFRFPILGMGLPALAPGVFHGPVLTATVVLGAVAALVVPALVVWRRPTLVTALVGGGLGLLGTFLPATNFRPPYLVLVVGFLACGWLGLDAPAGADEGSADLPATGAPAR